MEWYHWLIILAIQGVLMLWVSSALRKVKTGQSDASAEQEKIFNLYQQIEEMMDSFEDYVGEMHEQLEEKRTELLELNRQAQVMYLQALETAAIPVAAIAPPADIFQSPPSGPEMTEALNKRDAGGKSGKNAPAKGNKGSHKTAEQKPSRLTDKDKEALSRFATKAQKVRFLMSRGLSLDEVAKELSIGKGEVLLITELDKS